MTYSRSFLQSLRWGVAILAMGTVWTAQAKVSVEATLCSQQRQLAVDSYASAILNRLAVAARETEQRYGTPEAIIVSTALPDAAIENARETEARAEVILKYMRSVGIAYKEHGVMRRVEARPTDFGCSAGEAAIEVEILFSHKLDVAPIKDAL